MEDKLTHSLFGGKLALMVCLAAIKIIRNSKSLYMMMDLGPVPINSERRVDWNYLIKFVLIGEATEPSYQLVDAIK